MRASLLTENLIDKINPVGKILPSHSQIPILTSVLLEVIPSGIRLSSTDLEFGITTIVPGKTEEEGGVLLPGRQFLEVVNNLGKEKINIFQEKDQVVLEAQTGTFRFQAVSKEEFPKMYEEKGELIQTFTEEDFKNTFSKLVFAVSTDEGRPHLTGIYIGVKGDDVHFVATDGYRMSLVKKKASGGVTPDGIIISQRLIVEALALKNREKIDLFVFDKGSQAILETADTTLIGRLIEGAYPDYQKVIPQKTGTTIEVDREEFLKAARSITVFARENAQVVVLELAENSLTLKVPATSIGDAQTVVEGIMDGEKNHIAFNIRFIIDLLKSLDTKKVKISITSPLEPCLFTTPEDDSFLHVIMPVRVEG